MTIPECIEILKKNCGNLKGLMGLCKEENPYWKKQLEADELAIRILSNLNEEKIHCAIYSSRRSWKKFPTRQKIMTIEEHIAKSIITEVQK